MRVKLHNSFSQTISIAIIENADDFDQTVAFTLEYSFIKMYLSKYYKLVGKSEYIGFKYPIKANRDTSLYATVVIDSESYIGKEIMQMRQLENI